ncbi:MAG: hypothetical protein AB7U20_21030 [Planctomycetaceae bacterium]
MWTSPSPSGGGHLLRAQGLVHRISKTYRYTLSPRGRETITAQFTAQAANTRKLTELAA